MKEIEVYFVRHGETMFNLLHKMQGWSDSPLTERGLSLLDDTGEKLRNVKFDSIYSSDLKRASDTAKLLMSHNANNIQPLNQSKLFREVFFGSFEGILEEDAWRIIGKPYGLNTIEDFLDTNKPDFLRDATKEADVLKLAENSTEVHTRTQNGFDKILSENENHAKVLVVSHGGFIKDMVGQHVKPDVLRQMDFPRNGSITKTIVTNDRVFIDEYNI